jgi:sugar O-acyltransferase (sialic acid O-acetyltransferase NeuD family)
VTSRESARGKVIPVIGLGAGGHAKVVIDILRQLGHYELVGLLDPVREYWDDEVLGVPILGDDALLPKLYDKGVRHAFVGLGSSGNVNPRKRLYEKARQTGFEVVEAIHPQTIIAVSADIGDGPTIMAGAIINAATKLGENVIVNTGAIVEHDCRVGDHVHIAPGAHISGGVQIGSCAHVGVGATIIQGVHIGASAIVGAGSVVLHDVPPNVTVVGVPARVIEKRE